MYGHETGMKPETVVLFLLCVILGTLPACAASLTYSAESIEAKVIDAETKQPLEGVVVTANWQLEQGTVGGNIQAGQLMVLEAVTDKEGRFSFPAWGPKTAWQSFLVNDDPQLLLFKPGYEYRRLFNRYTSDRELRTRPLRRSDWNGKMIELKRFKGTIEAYEDQFESFNRDLEHLAADNPEECGWKKIPDTIRAMYRERKRLIKQGVNPNTLSSIDKRLLMNDEYFTKKGEGCGSPRAFFGDLQP